MSLFWTVLSTFSAFLSVFEISLNTYSIAFHNQNTIFISPFYVNIIHMPLTLEFELIQDDDNVCLFGILWGHRIGAH